MDDKFIDCEAPISIVIIILADMEYPLNEISRFHKRTFEKIKSLKSNVCLVSVLKILYIYYTFILKPSKIAFFNALLCLVLYRNKSLLLVIKK